MKKISSFASKKFIAKQTAGKLKGGITFTDCNMDRFATHTHCNDQDSGAYEV